jgi:hypothetical protein
MNKPPREAAFLMNKPPPGAAFFMDLRAQRVVLPEVVAPVEPLVPVLLLVDEDGDVDDEDGAVVVELPEAPMPDVEVELELGAVAEPLTVPADEPMPDAVPEAVPLVLHAASAARHAAVRRNFIMDPLLLTLNKCPRARRCEHELSLPPPRWAPRRKTPRIRHGRCRASKSRRAC